MVWNSFGAALSIMVLAANIQAQTPPTSGTYAVGTCRPSLPSYSTISAALAATPAPTVVDICPGTYNEQIEITQPVTLQGIVTGGSGQVIVSAAGGLQADATISGESVAPQLWVNNASGAVNVNDVTFDGSGNGVTNAMVVGILYENSPGALNRVATRNQKGGFGGFGMWLEGGASNPSITVQNCSVHDYDRVGIVIETAGANASELNATIKSNDLNASAGRLGVSIGAGSSSTVSSNWILAGNPGIEADPGAAGSISSNTLVNSFVGIEANADSVSISGNKVLSSLGVGILVGGIASSGTISSAIQSNTILGGPIGIEFECFSDANVQSNTINDVNTALNNVPRLLAATNTYYNVATIRNAGFCPRSR